MFENQRPSTIWAEAGGDEEADSAEMCNTRDQGTNLRARASVRSAKTHRASFKGKKEGWGEERVAGSCGAEIKIHWWTGERTERTLFIHFNRGCDALSNTCPRCLPLALFHWWLALRTCKWAVQRILLAGKTLHFLSCFNLKACLLLALSSQYMCRREQSWGFSILT